MDEFDVLLYKSMVFPTQENISTMFHFILRGFPLYTPPPPSSNITINEQINKLNGCFC